MPIYVNNLLTATLQRRRVADSFTGAFRWASKSRRTVLRDSSQIDCDKSDSRSSKVNPESTSERNAIVTLVWHAPLAAPTTT